MEGSVRSGVYRGATSVSVASPRHVFVMSTPVCFFEIIVVHPRLVAADVTAAGVAARRGSNWRMITCNST